MQISKNVSSSSYISCRDRRTTFASLPGVAQAALEQIKTHCQYPEHTVLFNEKQQPRGAWMICEGQVKLSVSSSEGKVLTLRVAQPGEIVGLSEAMLGNPYEFTAETLYPCKIAFIRREDLLRFLAQHPQAYRCIAEELTSQFHSACEQLRTLGLAASVPGRLARLILDWGANGQQVSEGTRIRVPLTQEQIAEFIGTTRETVSRTLSDFRQRKLVMREGSMLMIPSKTALEHVAST